MATRAHYPVQIANDCAFGIYNVRLAVGAGRIRRGGLSGRDERIDRGDRRVECGHGEAARGPRAVNNRLRAAGANICAGI